MKVRIRTNNGDQAIIHGFGLGPSYAAFDISEGIFAALSSVSNVDIEVVGGAERADRRRGPVLVATTEEEHGSTERKDDETGPSGEVLA